MSKNTVFSIQHMFGELDQSLLTLASKHLALIAKKKGKVIRIDVILLLRSLYTSIRT